MTVGSIVCWKQVWRGLGRDSQDIGVIISVTSWHRSDYVNVFWFIGEEANNSNICSLHDLEELI